METKKLGETESGCKPVVWEKTEKASDEKLGGGSIIRNVWDRNNYL